uniref:Uncharacterized protein n=1 Tax=Anguilla anguilla TaxID=7936 RepID=A0A0E9TN64_ANGAN
MDGFFAFGDPVPRCAFRSGG